jgi:hypothetical protein
MGVAWVPESVTRLRRPGVVYRPVADAGLRCETSLIWRPAAPPVVARFVAHVQAQPVAAAPAAPVQQRQSAAGRSRRRRVDPESP